MTEILIYLQNIILYNYLIYNFIKDYIVLKWVREHTKVQLTLFNIHFNCIAT